MSEPVALAEAIREIRDLGAEAARRGDPDSSVGSLATVDSEGNPSTRVLFAQFVDGDGPVIFINRNSGKARHLRHNPSACLNFYWPRLEHQVVIEGRCCPLDDNVADEVWRKRPRDSQLAAWTSDPTAMADSERSRRDALTEAKKQFDGGEIPRPETWEAYRLEPRRITSWPTGWHRMYPRKVWERDADGVWALQLSQP